MTCLWARPWVICSATLLTVSVQVMHLDWSPGQSCQLDKEPWLWQGCKPYHSLNSANLENKSPFWPTLANNKLPLKEDMDFDGSSRTGHFQDLFPQTGHWQGSDDRTLSPYMSDHHYQYGMPTASSAPGTELYISSKGVHQVTALPAVCICKMCHPQYGIVATCQGTHVAMLFWQMKILPMTFS